ncbi:hypothetical protein CGZ75_01025 [Paenibacillus herberti]|uniref:Uncharacterized protein n=1 Tax=Paenibacillus herberti TaxID=1619309 RepID=A0A229P0F9_9BACL|nr:hypothetical protein CGZ75_01025 [Paenibacillus herberti]
MIKWLIKYCQYRKKGIEVISTSVLYNENAQSSRQPMMGSKEESAGQRPLLHSLTVGGALHLN